MGAHLRPVSILMELAVLMGLVYSLFNSLRFTLIDYRLNKKYHQFIRLVLIIIGCLALVFLIAHLISFYPKAVNTALFKETYTKKDFWSNQQIYIIKIFSPVIFGFLIILPGLVALFILSFKKMHQKLWRLGKQEDRSGQILKRIKTLLATVFINSTIIDEIYPGSMHLLIFWGTILIFLGKAIRIISISLELTNPPQSIFLFASFISEFGGLFVIIGGLMAIFRRYILKPPRLDTKSDRTLIFIWGFFIIITGYFVKGYRIAISGIVPSDWLLWAPISYHISKLFLILPTQPLNELLLWHRVFIHIIPAIILFIYVIVSHSPLKHLFLSPLNVYYRSLKPKGILSPLPDLEESETFGVRGIFEFTWKQLMDLEACTACGRCQDICPAFLSGKPLSPKKMTQNLKEDLWYHSPSILSKQDSKMEIEPIIGTSVTEEELWSCTACMACEEVCPIYIEQIQKNIDLRRYLVLMETKFPSGLRLVFKNLMNNNNPWGMSRGLRGDWAKGLNLSQEPVKNGILFWVGCAGSFDDRNIKITTSIARILSSVGIPFWILGTQESCCGDPARRTGNEYIFQTLTKANIELFNEYKVRRILTMCPHCFHTLKNEYPQFGGNFTVLHYTQLFSELLSTGVLKLRKPIQKMITYHDSCYLGRANNIYEPPRKILKSIPQLRVVEMRRRKNKSFCCGAGGGRMWLEENIGIRINQMRTIQAFETKAKLIGTACPYCLTMLRDGVKELGKEESVSVYDLSELIEMALSD